MKISVALCTYNGEKFLEEQLESYLNQIRLPDELVICDDCSKDSTREIITKFASSAPFPVRLCFNEQNIGFIQNFGKAIELCTGDIIALSDQDDVWRADKLKVVEAAFAQSESAGLVYADAEVVDENLQSLNLTMWQGIGFERFQGYINLGRAFESLVTDGGFLGSSMAFRADLRSLVLPIPPKIFFPHDNWIALVISAVADILLIDDTLIKYRQHQEQASIGGVRFNDKHKFQELLDSAQRINRYDGLLEQLKTLKKRIGKSSYMTDEVISKIDLAVKHIHMRNRLPKTFSIRLLKVSRELFEGRYHLYSKGFRSAAKDLLISNK